MSKALFIVGLFIMLVAFWMSAEFAFEYADARKWSYRFGSDERRRALRSIQRSWAKSVAPLLAAGLALCALSLRMG